MTDPLAMWWRIPISVKRKLGDGAYGAEYAAPTTELVRLRNKRKKVLAPDGSEVISEAGASMSTTVAVIPVGSLVTLPDGREAEVLAESLHHDGAGLTPNFYSIDLT